MSDFSDERLTELAAGLRLAHRNGDRVGAVRAARKFIETLLDNGWEPKNWTGNREEALARGARILLSGFDH